MLLWELVSKPRGIEENGHGDSPAPLRAQRLPFDKRCAAITKSGRRCREIFARAANGAFFTIPTSAPCGVVER